MLKSEKDAGVERGGFLIGGSRLLDAVMVFLGIEYLKPAWREQGNEREAVVGGSG